MSVKFGYLFMFIFIRRIPDIRLIFLPGFGGLDITTC